MAATGAKGIILSYEKFYIPEGGQLFLYNKDKSQVLGAYNHTTNQKGGRFSTQFTLGDQVTIEYVASTISDEQPRIVLEDIGYIYRNSSEEYELPEINPEPGGADYCMVNVNCPEGDEWQKQKRGVVQLLAKDLSRLNETEDNLRYWHKCSGSLINNTSKDETPYILTAAHCFFNGSTANEMSDFETAQYYFNYEWPDCENGDFDILPETTRCLIGSEGLSYNPYIRGGADGLLLVLNEEVPTEWNPYFNGWDRTSNTPQSGVCIHHPLGDVKKISTYTQEPEISSYGLNYKYWWSVMFSETETAYGVTASGSSGSPLFNEKGLIVGSLTGGGSKCDTTSQWDGPFTRDSYGMFRVHWDISSFSGHTMKEYLDPENANVLTLEGFDPNDPEGIESPTIKERLKIVVFPNPTENEFYINTRSIIQDLTVTDMNGRIVYSLKNYKSSTVEVPTSGWSKGIYNVTVNTKDGVYTDKIIKK